MNPVWGNTLQLKWVAVFCGSSSGNKPVYREAAVSLGRVLVSRGIGLVYGGGGTGLMGVLADSVMAAGGDVVGIMPEGLVRKEVAHKGLTTLHVVDSMHARKAMMAGMADAFIAMPGGFGTFEEFCEAVTWTQLGIQNKPCGLLNVDGYYDALLGMFDHAVAEGFLKPGNRTIVIAEREPERLLERLQMERPAAVAKWMNLKQS